MVVEVSEGSIIAGMAKRIKPVVGYETHAGIVTHVLPPSGKSRASRVRFQCSHCLLLAETRWTRFHLDQIKSCGCLATETFYEIFGAQAEELGSDKHREIFEHVAEWGTESAAERFNISSYVAFFAWRLHERVLLRRKDGRRIADRALESGSYESVAKRYRLSVQEVKRMAILEFRRRAEAADWKQGDDYKLIKKQRSRLIPPHKSLLKDLLSFEPIWGGARPHSPWRTDVYKRHYRNEFCWDEMRRGSAVLKLERKIKRLGMTSIPECLRAVARRFLTSVSDSRRTISGYKSKAHWDMVSHRMWKAREEQMAKDASTLSAIPIAIEDDDVPDAFRLYVQTHPSGDLPAKRELDSLIR